MGSSNNQSSQITAATANDQRQTVKKLTVGVSSILLGFAFAGATTVHADTATQPTGDAEHISATTTNQSITNSSEQVLKTTPATETSAASSAASASAVKDTTTTANSVATVNADSAVNSASAAVSEVSNQNDLTSAKSEKQQAATVADNYEAAVNASLKQVTPTSTSAAASESSAVNSASTAQTANSAASQSSQAQASSAAEEVVVAAVPMTNYDVQPYSQAQREANAQAGLKLATDFVNILTAPTITAKIGQGITFIKDTINLITRHPLAYQRYQNMTARQMRLANRQQALALKQKQMELQHKPQWQINFVISQQRFLANRQERLAIQRQTMVSYLRADANRMTNTVFA
ncbi:hypothetical protein H5S09_11000 [Limosilactobacillus sp. STM2_1]|uniref:YSIRK-type signal peptide-containing protein n=1 Tax=Limosilactobacillus rudii TaxID=2759755 RepID=A0A7W3UMS7_9LACO|nr:hypothetical protein [Limosilactobacillus rudii]MBB1080427.1 hypothetical protein [Limosilactobacillus rudii]MBB1098453.1 hypothetical protein [Limosilactobacillus rudii]MCD7135461.1 hypothetical protein [Limosilactobacillus rudii]